MLADGDDNAYNAGNNDDVKPDDDDAYPDDDDNDNDDNDESLISNSLNLTKKFLMTLNTSLSVQG